MKVLDHSLLAAVTVAMLSARSDAAPLPSFRSIEVSRYAPHAARDLPTQLLPLGFSFSGWIRSTMLNNGHGCNHGPNGCANGGKPGGTPPHSLATHTDGDTDKRAPAPDRHSPIEDCAQSPTGCQGHGAPPDATDHTTGETGEEKPFLGGGCSHSPTGCAPAMPSDPDIGIREESYSTSKDQQPSFCSSPGGCAPPPGGGTHGRKRDVAQLQDEASVLAARGKGQGGCAHSPTGCGPPSGGGGHGPHPAHPQGRALEMDQAQVQKRALTATDAELVERGKSDGDCAHSPTGCSPPGDGGNRPSEPEHPRRDIEGHQEEERTSTINAAPEELAARGKGQGGCAHSPTGCGPPGSGGARPPHPEHPQRDHDGHQEEKRTLAINAVPEELAARGKGKGGCAHSPTGCGPPGNGGAHPPHPEHLRRDLEDQWKEEVTPTTSAAPEELAARGKGQGGCAHSPTGCGPPGSGGAHPPHPEHPRRYLAEAQVQNRALTPADAPHDAVAALAARGKGQGGCAHSPTGCGPPGSGGAHPPHPALPKEQKRDIIHEEERELTPGLITTLRAKPGRACGHSPTGCTPPPGNGGPNPGHGKRNILDIDVGEAQTQPQALAPALAERSRFRGECGMSPTGCIAPPNGGTHVGQKGRREAILVEDSAEGETTESGALAALAARGKSRGGCNHSPTGCPPGGGGPHVHK